MKTKRLLAILAAIVSMPAQAHASGPWSISFSEVQAMDPAAREKLWDAYREFLRDAESAQAFEVSQSGLNQLYAMLMSDAEADGTAFDCFFGGWPSKSSGTVCDRPQRGNADQYKKLLELPANKATACGSDPANNLLCNPMLFGNGVCVSIASPQDRQYAFRKCEAEFDKLYKNATTRQSHVSEALWSIASDKPELFTSLVGSVDEVCTSGLQKTQPMCKKLQDRLQEVRTGAGANSGNDKSVDGFTADMVKGWSDNINEAINDFKEKCGPCQGKSGCGVDFGDGRVLSCDAYAGQISERIAKLNDLNKFLKAKELPIAECEECRKAQQHQEPIEHLADQVDQLACKAGNPNDGSFENAIKCNLGRSVAKAAYVTSWQESLMKRLKVDKTHCKDDSSCLEQFVTSITSAFVQIPQAVMALGSAAKDKMKGWWNAAWSHDSAASDTQKMAGHVSEAEAKEASQNPEGFIKRIFNGIMNWVWSDILCLEWEGGGPNASRNNCKQPFKSECLEWNDTINIFCRVAGEVGSAAATAGAANLASHLASVSSKLGGVLLARIAESSPKVARALEAAEKAGAAGARFRNGISSVGTRVGEAGSALTSPIRAAKNSVLSTSRSMLNKVTAPGTKIAQWVADSRAGKIAGAALDNSVGRWSGKIAKGGAHMGWEVTKMGVKLPFYVVAAPPWLLKKGIQGTIELNVKAAKMGWNFADKIFTPMEHSALTKAGLITKAETEAGQLALPLAAEGAAQSGAAVPEGQMALPLEGEEPTIKQAKPKKEIKREARAERAAEKTQKQADLDQMKQDIRNAGKPAERQPVQGSFEFQDAPPAAPQGQQDLLAGVPAEPVRGAQQPAAKASRPAPAADPGKASAATKQGPPNPSVKSALPSRDKPKPKRLGQVASTDPSLGKDSYSLRPMGVRAWGDPSTGSQYRIFVKTTPEQAIEVADRILPELRRMGLPHEILADMERFRTLGGTSQGNLITIFLPNPRDAVTITRRIEEITNAAKPVLGFTVPK